MAKIYINGDWYDDVSGSSLYESEFERIFLQFARDIYPGFMAFPFKQTVRSDDEAAIADLVLMRDDYSAWWVVEVEKGDHSLRSHVLPQVKTLGQAYYGQETADYLSAKRPELDKSKLRLMIKGSQPRVLVVVNENKPEWIEPLSHVDAELAVIELFMSDSNQTAIRINGFTPKIEATLVSRCRLHRYIPNLLVLDSPVALRNQEELKIYLHDGVTYWATVEMKNIITLCPVRAGNPLNKGVEYQLVQTDSGELRLEEFRD